MLDGDIYGHSIPHMLGVHQKPIAVDEMIVPPVRGDLKLMSIGFFLEENAPIMWRGPMLHKALEQFLSDVHWGELDTLLVDMPPGTGDVAMSLGQLLPRAEALVVTTPQPAAQQVAVRAAQMAQKTGMRVLGAVENMSYLAGTGQELFGSGGGQALADEMGVPLLARIPLDPLMREAADDGLPGRRGGARLGGRGRDRCARRVGRGVARRARSASRSPSSRRLAACAGAAFFDLDRTLISRSSSLALAGTFRRSAGSSGAGSSPRRRSRSSSSCASERVRRASGRRRTARCRSSRALSVDVMREIAAEAWDRCSSRSCTARRSTSQRHTLRAASPSTSRRRRSQEVVEEVSRRARFAGAIASRAEVA